jgi:hypothetical protein
LLVKLGNSSAASAVSVCIKCRRASSTFCAFFRIAGFVARFLPVTLRVVGDVRFAEGRRRFSRVLTRLLPFSCLTAGRTFRAVFFPEREVGRLFRFAIPGPLVAPSHRKQ